MSRLGLLVGLLVVGACDGAEQAPVDVAPLAGVYTGTHTADALDDDPVVSPASVTVVTDPTTRAISFTLAVRGEAPVVVPGAGPVSVVGASFCFDRRPTKRLGFRAAAGCAAAGAAAAGGQ